MISVAGQRAITELRRRVEEHVMRLPVSFFDATQSGVLVQRVIDAGLIGAQRPATLQDQGDAAAIVGPGDRRVAMARWMRRMSAAVYAISRSFG